MSVSAVRVRVPATSANLGPGFDAFGLALDLCDEVEVRRAGTDLDWQVAGEGQSAVRRGESSLLMRAMRLGMRDDDFPGLRVRCVNAVPSGRGLGSSAAAVVAGLLAGRALAGLGTDPTSSEVLTQATSFEGHPDNAAACLLGGVTVAWMSGGPHAVRLDPAPELGAVVFVPRSKLATVKARGLLPATVPHADAAHAAGRAALLAVAITSRPELLLAATEDRLHQQYRAQAMPASAALVARLRDAGFAAVISGAGPSVLGLTTTAEEAGRLVDMSTDEGAGESSDFLPHPLPLRHGGATVEVLD